jgi:hypothetical protein
MREFLARALPWPQEGDQPSYVNVHHVIKITDDKGQPVMRGSKQAVAVPGRACRSVDEAVRTIEWVLTLKTDAYVCMSGQRTAEEKTSRKGRKYLSAVRGMNNIARHKSLYVDVDVKPEDPKHGYATREEAVTEFVRIRNELGLPPQSFAISSGSGGFHAHWTFVDPIDHDRWAKLAGALCAGFVSRGFRGDTQCIVDGVRLLRVPGTWNYKTGSPTPVTQLGNTNPDYFVDAIEQVLSPFIGMYQPATIKAPTLRPSSLGPPSAVFAQTAVPELTTGMDVLLPTIEEIASACPFLSVSLSNGGAANSNPLWMQTVNVALFTQAGRDTAHRLSSGHAGYSQAETDAFFDRQSDTKRTRDLGWPRCQTIASYGAPQCQTCPRLQAGGSPLGRPPVAIAPSQMHAHGPVHGPVVPALAGPAMPASVVAGPLAQAPLPSNYQYDANNLICLVTTDDAGVQQLEPVTSFVIDKPWLQQDPPVLNFSTHTHQGHERQIRLPYETIVDKSGFAKTMARQGMLVGLGNTKRLGDFFVSWIEKMRADAKNVVHSQPFGWSTRGGKLEGFVYAGHLWSAAVPRPSANPDPVLSSQYAPVGDLAPWTTAAKLITGQSRPALDAILAASFAAPLVRFTGQTGLFLSTYSTLSGIGKSTALKVAQSVWGNPQKAVQSLSDTQNAVLKKIGDIKNLPLFWDELKTDEDTQRFVNVAFQLSLGKEKSRLSADTSYRDPGTWQTLLCSTSNNSILAYVISQTKTTAAGIYRVFEFDVPRGVKGQISPADAALVIGALNDNYGYAGLRYAQFLGAQHERIAAEVAETSRYLEKEFKVQADERFWISLVVTLICGAHYANELGLTEIDVPALREFLMKRFQQMRVQRRESSVDITENINVIAIVSRYLNEHKQGFCLTTNYVHRTAGRPPAPQAGSTMTSSITLKCDPARIRAVRIQVGEDDHWVRLIKAPFEEWLEERGYTASLILKQLTEKFSVVEARGRLGAGTSFTTAAEPLLEFNYGDPVFQGMIDL